MVKFTAMKNDYFERMIAVNRKRLARNEVIKYVIVILLICAAFVALFVFCGCSVISPIVKEDVLYKTRIYCGNFVQASKTAKKVQVMTDEDLFTLNIDTVPKIPKDVRCYIKLVLTGMVGTGNTTYKPYFTWNEGDSVLLPIKYNFITGDLLK